MIEFEKTYSKIMEDVESRAEELGLLFQGKQDMGDGTYAPVYVNPENGKSFIVPLDANIDDIARQYGVEIPLNRFDKAFAGVMEDMVAGPGGAFGDLGGQEHGGALGNSDWYAPGDARIPKVLGAKEEKKSKKKKRNKKMKNDGGNADQSKVGKVNMSIQRRVFPNM